MSNESTGAPPAVVTRALCASQSRISGSVMDELLAIRNRLTSPDLGLGVRCALLHTSGWFVLWIEGSDQAVDSMLQRAAGDPRNAHQKLLHRSRGPSLLCERVLVTSTQSAINSAQFELLLGTLTRVGATVASPLALWQRLSEPCTIVPARSFAEPVHHIALVAAEDHGPVDQLRRIGERFGSPVVYQRFGSAKTHTSDVGTAYVDVPQGDRIGRIRILSRRAMAHPMVRNALAKLDALVLMLGSRPGASIDLATGAANCVNALKQQPTIYLLGAEDEAAQACARLLERSGAKQVARPAFDASDRDLSTLLPMFGLSLALAA